MNKNFVFLCLCAFFSSTAFSCYLLFEQWYVLDYLNQPKLVGYLLATTAVPRVVTMIFGGALSDKYSNKKMLTRSLLLRIIIIFLCITLFSKDALSIIALFGIAAVFGILDSIHQPSINSIVPKIFVKTEIQNANSFFLGVIQLSLFIGPVIAGIFISSYGYKAILYSIQCILFFSLCFVLLMNIPHSLSEEDRSSNLLEHVYYGIQYIKKDLSVKSIVLFIFFINLFYFGPITVGIPILIKEVFDGGVDLVGFTQGTYAVGMISGSLIARLLKIKLNISKMIVFSLILGFLLFSLSFHMSRIGLILNIFVLGLASAIINVLLISKLQSDVDQEMIGTIVGIVSSLSSGLVPISYIFVGMLIGMSISSSTIIMFSGVSIFFLVPLLVVVSKTKV